MVTTYAYIDWANLDKAARELGYKIDYKKFYGWLRQKYSLGKVYLFTGFSRHHEELYEYLREYGYTLVLKETFIDKNGKIKGNCDTELVLQATQDYYEKKFNTCIIISGDGDFRCLVDFLHERSGIVAVLAPRKDRSSILLRRIPFSLIFLDDHYYKFSEKIISGNKKAPDADVSA